MASSQRLDADRPVVVIGAGWAGLAAAHELRRAGVPVVVLEHAPTPGGRTFSFFDPASGEMLDNGEHVLLGLCTAFARLLDEAGLGSAVAWQGLRIPVRAGRRGDGLLYSKRLPGRWHLAPALLRYSLLSLADRMRVLQAGARLARPLPAPQLDTITFADWLRDHHHSVEGIHDFWDLVGTAVFNARSDQVSAELAAETFGLLMRSGWRGGRLGLFTRPLGDLSQAYSHHLKERLGVRFEFGQRAEQILTEGGRVHAVATRSGKLIAARAVVAAVPHDRFAALIARSGLTTRVNVPALAWSPILNVYLFYSERVFHGTVAALPDVWGAFVFNRGRLLHGVDSANDGRALVASISAADGLSGRRGRDIADTVNVTLAQSLGIPPASYAKAVWQPHATFLAAPGTHRARPSTITAVPGLFIAGDWTNTGWPACLEGAVRSGITAAMACRSPAGGVRP